MAKLKTSGLYLLIFLFTLLWLAACSEQPKIAVAEASMTPRTAATFEAKWNSS